MLPNQTPFRTGWYGQGLANIRADLGTYGLYPTDPLPPLPFELTGDFTWLRQQPTQKSHINEEKPADNEVALSSLAADADKNRLTLPAEFLSFFQSPDLHKYIRSCTDCFLDLSPVCVPSPLGGGFLVRFLADSQSCVFWYLYLQPPNPEHRPDHCVVATPDFYSSEEEQWQENPPDPSQIIFCEQSFERFICRFYLENEIWFAGYEKRPLLPEHRQYLELYGRKNP
jgi:hypothetical protein